MTPLAEDERLEHMARIHFCSTVSGRIGRMLKRHGITTVFQPPMKTGQLLGSVKDALGLRMSGLY